MRQRLTKRAQRAVNKARTPAGAVHEGVVYSNALLRALCLEPGSAAAETLRTLGHDPQHLAGVLESEAGGLSPEQGTVDIDALLAVAAEEAERLNKTDIGTEHLLFALMREDKTVSDTVLEVLRKG